MVEDAEVVSCRSPVTGRAHSLTVLGHTGQWPLPGRGGYRVQTFVMAPACPPPPPPASLARGSLKLTGLSHSSTSYKLSN